MVKNNFDFLRLLFASFVIIGHSYTLSGHSTEDFLGKVTEGALHLQDFALYGFFLVSGFYIYPSLKRSRTIWVYLKKRILRIFPGILFMALIVCLLGVFIYKGTWQLYFTQWPVYKYFIKTPLLVLNNSTFYDLFENNPSKVINGSIWTIAYEFFWYLAILAFFIIKDNQRLQKIILFILCVVFYFYNIIYFNREPNFFFLLSGSHILNFGNYFLIGAFASLYYQKIDKNKGIILLFGLFICLFAKYFTLFGPLVYIILPTLILPLGLYKTPIINNIGESIGDLSYGVYIFGWPVQQTLFHFFKFGPYKLMVFSLLVSLILGYLSWHLVEKRALALKKYL